MPTGSSEPDVLSPRDRDQIPHQIAASEITALEWKLRASSPISGTTAGRKRLYAAVGRELFRVEYRLTGDAEDVQQVWTGELPYVATRVYNLIDDACHGRTSPDEIRAVIMRAAGMAVPVSFTESLQVGIVAYQRRLESDATVMALLRRMAAQVGEMGLPVDISCEDETRPAGAEIKIRFGADSSLIIVMVRLDSESLPAAVTMFPPASGHGSSKQSPWTMEADTIGELERRVLPELLGHPWLGWAMTRHYVACQNARPENVDPSR